MSWTQKDVADHMARIRGGDALAAEQAKMNATRALPNVRHQRGQMNKLEASYAGWLSVQKLADSIDWFEYEAITLKLADGVRYTPDFLVASAEGLACHECKGFMRDDARIKLRVAAKLFPWFRFYLVRKKLVRDGGGFDIQAVNAS